MATTTARLSGAWIPSRIKALRYGSGTVKQHLLDHLPSPSSKAFIVTGNSLATKTDLIKQIEQLLGDRHAGTFSQIKQHAPIADLDAATDLVLQDRSIDTIISVGGGSPIDASKNISHRTHARTGAYLFHITVPTTISAAECTAGGGFTDAQGLKQSLRDVNIIPDVVLYDATFALPTPQHLWLSTGLRSVDHALELLYHPDASELTKLNALAAAHKLFTYLPAYKRDPTDEGVITQLQLAAYASLAFLGTGVKHGLGLSHALGYALGAPYAIPHGVTSCLTLGHVVKLKARDPVAAAQIVRAAPFVGVDVTGDERRDAEAVGQKVLDLVEELGLATDLTRLGVARDQVDVIAGRATGQKEGELFESVRELVGGLYGEGTGKL